MTRWISSIMRFQDFRSNDNVKILWAGCQRVYDVQVAAKSGCDIITVPEGVLKKMGRLGTSLHDFSLKTSYDFHMGRTRLRALRRKK